MDRIDRLARLPDWPARMQADIAALYMGVSEGSFLARYGAHGVKEGANRLWSRRQLDALIANQFALPQPPGLAESPAPEEDTWGDL